MSSYKRSLPISPRSGRSVRLGRILWFFTLTVVVLFCQCRAEGSDLATYVFQGQSQTILPNGLVLLAGGYDKGHTPAKDLFVVAPDGTVRALTVKLSSGRAGHTATVLPDGRVLIFGGYGVNGKLVSFGELLDPVAEDVVVLNDFRLLPRAFHTATLMTDGKVVVVGGVGTGGDIVRDIQVWNSVSGSALAFDPGPNFPRQKHTATLLPNGKVQIAGGIDDTGLEVRAVEQYDPAEDIFQVAESKIESDAPTVEETIPIDRSTGVHITHRIAVRFGSEMSILSLNQSNVSLVDGNGNRVQASVTATESGRLLFVIPTSPLEFATDYVLTIQNVVEAKTQSPLPASTVHFTTEDDPNAAIGDTWIPGADDFNGQWHSHTGPSEWQKEPPLHAKEGVTALTGQVLRLNGRPLQNVLLEVDGQRAFSDRTGRFLVENVHGGHHVLVIDGRPANRAGVDYGLFEAGVDLVANQTAVLKYTIWMTALDTAHAIAIPSPTTAIDTVVKTPLLPGLELHLPQNTIIRDRDGHAVKQLTITPIPLDKPPFPLPPGVQVPIYFTIQPGGASIDVRSSNPAEVKGAFLVYPNPYHSSPGTPFNFWNYDADSKGWYIYGHGKVSKTGTSVIPDPGVLVYELTGAMVGDAGGPFPFPPLQPECKQCDPTGGSSGPGNGDGDGGVDLSTGNYTYDDDDLSLPDNLSIDIPRSYRSNDSVSRAFGIGTTLGYDQYMTGDQHPYSYLELIQPDGSRARFNSISPAGTNYTNVTYASSSDPSAFYGATIPSYNSGSCAFPTATWTVQIKDGMQLCFPDSDTISNYKLAAPVGITDRYGNALTFTRDPTGNLTQITSSNGKSIQFTYDPSNRITQATDNSSRTTSYSYDSTGHLATVTDANGGTTSYTYDGNDNLLTVTDPRGVVTVSNDYDSAGRIVKQTLANQGTYLYTWTTTQNTSEIFSVSNPTGVSASDTVGFRSCSTCSIGYTPMIAQVAVTDPRGFVHRTVFDSLGRKSSETSALNQPEQQTYSYSYYSDNSIRSVTDPLGHTTTYTYDAKLNPVEVDQLAETSQPVISTFTYDPTFSQLTSATDPLGHTTRYTVDSHGNTTTMKDPLGHGPNLTYNSDGTLSTIVDDQGNTTHLVYDHGLVTSIVDPLGNETNKVYDAEGRAISVTDPLGNQTRYSYDNLDRPVKMTDSTGNNTLVAYDPSGNLTRVTDALNHQTVYTYDGMNHVSTRTDPLQRHESYTYDLAGLPSTYTDRKGQVTSYNLDAIGRPSTISFGVQSDGSSESTISYSYDGDSRLLSATDSSYGLISRAYDDLGRLTTETIPTGSVTYAYDSAGRRLTMQVAGQQQVSHSWDDADRLAQIGQGASVAGFTYDSLNRRVTATLPNGIVAAYLYDADSDLVGITYSHTGTDLGDLNYTYDADSRRSSVSGSLASVVIPSPVAGATYDAGNELTNWNGVSLSYDANGNTLDDGLHAYSWNTRNQLIAINSGGSASYRYDAFGRRTTRIISGATSGFQYDGANPVQENTGTGSIVNLAGGLDDYIARTDSNGTSAYLSDALGGTVALVDGSGTIQTRYSYEPFGATTQVGAPTTNSFGFTGREIDAAGLYFYRARYYNPSVGRFISEDPIGFGGGINAYVYVEDNPTNLGDPSGLRDILIAIWNQQGASVGHAAAFEMDATNSPILSEFPATHTYKDQLLDPQSWQDTIQREDGRDPNEIYAVHVPNDAGFDKAVKDQSSRRTWDWYPTRWDKQQTNCVRAIDQALNAGGIPAPDFDLPGNLGNWLTIQARMARLLGSKRSWSVTKLK
jgi:RHS repeat-associated protein